MKRSGLRAFSAFFSEFRTTTPTAAEPFFARGLHLHSAPTAAFRRPAPVLATALAELPSTPSRVRTSATGESEVGVVLTAAGSGAPASQPPSP